MAVCRSTDRSCICRMNRRRFEVNVGAVVVATGFKPYEPHEGEYGYGVFPQVITLPKFMRLLALNDEGEALVWDEQAGAQCGLHSLCRQPPA